MIDLIPAPYRWAAYAFLLAGAAAALFGYGAHKHSAGVNEGKAAVQQAWDHERAAQMEAAASAANAYRAEEQRRSTAQQEIAHEADKFNEKARTARAAADAAAVSLRDRFTAVASGCGRPTSDSTAAPASPAASSPGDLLAYVQRRIDDAAGELAGYADAAAGAGLACQRAYSTLTP